VGEKAEGIEAFASPKRAF